MSGIVSRKWTKCAVAIDLIYVAAVLFTIVGLSAVETAVQKIEKGKGNSEPTQNSTRMESDKNEPNSGKIWKLWVGAVTTFLLTFLQFWSAGKFLYGTSSLQSLEKCKRNALLWIPVKILLDIVGISIQIAIFGTYVLGIVGVLVRILWVFLVVKFVKEIKMAINAS